MNIEREYYENDDFWRDDAIRAEDLHRVEMLAARIPAPVRTVLEVGCGNGIFANSIADTGRFARVIGLDRSVAALRYVRTRKICASIDAIPLPDASFDLVAALEVIEHLPARVFSDALSEMARLSAEFILISVPYNEDLRTDMVECLDCRSRFNPNYHMQSFDERRMGTLLDPFGFRAREVLKIGEYSRYRGVDRIRRRRARSLSNPFTTAIPCPMCGALLPPAPAAAPRATAARASGPRSIVKRVWPRQTRHNWITGLYERRRK